MIYSTSGGFFSSDPTAKWVHLLTVIPRSPRIGGRDTGSQLLSSGTLDCAAAAAMAAATEGSFLRPPEGGVSHTDTEWRRRRLRRLVVGVLAYLARSAATGRKN